MSLTPFKPKFTITPGIANALMSIEADRQAIDSLPLRVSMLESLRRTARLVVRYSTQIEGNRLTAAQVEEVLAGGGRFPGRERDENEVRNHNLGLDYVINRDTSEILTEAEIKTIHGLVISGRAKPTPYRKTQNRIGDSQSGRIVYLPLEAKDVPILMKSLAYRPYTTKWGGVVQTLVRSCFFSIYQRIEESAALQTRPAI
jgi:Fic family protein